MKTEHEIQIWVENQIERLEMKYSLGHITHEEYTERMQDIFLLAECEEKKSKTSNEKNQA